MVGRTDGQRTLQKQLRSSLKTGMREGETCHLYKMVTRKMLRIHEGKYVFSEKKTDL